MSPKQAAYELIEATVAMHESGVPLMRRVLPPTDTDTELWEHYPENDAVSPHAGSRYFYHCHPVEERGADEHGHFHMFMAKTAMSKPRSVAIAPIGNKARAQTPKVVHIAALSVNPAGLPIALFTVNRWVTNEWLYPHDQIMAAIDKFDLSGAQCDALVNKWLTGFVHLARPIISELLIKRDAALAAAGWDGENRALEILSTTTVDLQGLVETHIDG